MNAVAYALVAALLFAGTAAADDIANFDADFTIEGVDPSVDGQHTLNVRVYEGADGTPAAEVLVDGAPVLP